MRRLLQLAALVGVIAAFIGLMYLRFSGDDATRPGVIHCCPGEDVVVATRDIPSGTRIEANMVSIERVAPAQLMPDVYRDTAMVVGQMATNNIGAGEQVTYSDIEGPAVPEGMSAVALRIQQTTPVGGLVSPGAWVDVLAAFDGGSRVKTIAENVEVIAVVQRETGQDVVTFGGDPKAQPPPALVTVAVPPQSASLLLDAQLKASRLWLQLRPAPSRVP
jgi:Flp pilus assembly protein CpaB